MQLVTVGTKYQIVIPKNVRTKIKSLRPGKKVGVSTDEKFITINPEPQSWADRNYGLMKDAWKDIDPIAEVEKIRNEWEEKLEEQAKIWQGKDTHGKDK